MPKPTLDSQRGVSLPELVVVVALLALGLMVTVPLIADRVHDVKLQSAVSQFAVALRAARMVAVTTSAPVTVTVASGGGNSYEYVDASGRPRSFELPGGAWFDAGSNGTIVFDANGSVGTVATAILKAKLSSGRIRSWTVQVPASGIPAVNDDGYEHSP